MLKPRIHFNTVFSRILLFNILLVIIVTILPQMVFLNSFKSSYRDEINRNNMQLVAQIQKSIDGQVLEKAVTLPVTYLSELPSNEDLTYALQNDITKEPSKIGNIRNKLMDIKSTLNFLDSFDLYYTQGNLFFMDSGVQFLDDASSIKMHDMEWVNRIRNADMNVAWLPTRYVEWYQPRNIISFVRRVPFNALREDIKAVAIININEEVLHNYIQDVKSFNKGAVFIVDECGNIISHSDRSMLRKNIQETEYFKNILQSGGSGMFQTNINGKLNVVSFMKSAVNDWRYISISSIDQFYKKSYQLEKFLLVVGLLLLLVNLLVSVVFTKKSHEPMNNMIKTIRAMAVKFSGDRTETESEYKFLNNTIKNIEVKMEDLNYRLEVNKPLIRHGILLKLLTGKVSVHIDDDSLFDLDFKGERFVCFVLKLYQHSQLTFQERMLVNYSLVDLLNGEYAEGDIYALIDENNDVAGIINFNNTEDLTEIQSQMVERLESLLGVKYILCMGNSYLLTGEEIHTSYSEACICRKYTFIKTDKKVLGYGELEIDTRKETGSSPRLLEKIEVSARSADEEQLRFSIECMIEAVIVGGYKIDYCKNTVMDVVSLLRMTINTMGYSADELFGCDIRERCKSIRDIDEFRNWICEIISIYSAKANERKQSSQEELDIKIKKFIEENIYKELSLEIVAEGLHISAGHLSRVFKAKTGTTFSNYVTELKLQCAVRLLQEGKLPVKDVAARLGYHSVHHFIKIFREKYGYTPKEYQKISTWMSFNQENDRELK